MIAIPGERVPHKITAGEAAPFDGWLLSTPLFNDLMPCFRDQLLNPERDPAIATQPLPRTDIEKQD